MDYTEVGVWAGLTERLRRAQPWPLGACGRSDCPPGWSLDAEWDDYDVWLVLAGHGHARLEAAGPVRLAPGSVMLLRPGDRGRFTQDAYDRLTVAYCHFDFIDPRSGVASPLDDAWLPTRHVPFANPSLVAEPMQRAIRLLRGRQPLRQIAAAGALAGALVEVYLQDARSRGQAPDPPDARVQEVVEFVRDHPQRRLSLDEAADLVGLSPKYLSRVFSEQTGTSFREFALTARLEHAHYLLTETSTSVAAVARALGYRDLSLFSRQFRTRYGRAPGQARRQGGVVTR